jgi:hypothetical protein
MYTILKQNKFKIFPIVDSNKRKKGKVARETLPLEAKINCCITPEQEIMRYISSLLINRICILALSKKEKKKRIELFLFKLLLSFQYLRLYLRLLLRRRFVLVLACLRLLLPVASPRALSEVGPP